MSRRASSLALLHLAACGAVASSDPARLQAAALREVWSELRPAQGIATYCVFTGEGSGPGLMATESAPPELLALLPDGGPAVKPGPACERDDDAEVVDRESGRPAVEYVVSAWEPEVDEAAGAETGRAALAVSRVRGPRESMGWTCDFRRQGRAWKLEECRRSWST